jgi:hypothetical protein
MAGKVRFISGGPDINRLMDLSARLKSRVAVDDAALARVWRAAEVVPLM